MTYAPTNPVDVPPYQVQDLISTVVEDFGGHHISSVSSVNLTHPGHETSKQTQPTSKVQVRCAQALGPTFCYCRYLNLPFLISILGSEIYVGCSNGELIRFALQTDNPNDVSYRRYSQIRLTYFLQPGSYRILSRQTVPNEEPIDEIVLVPSLSRAFILSGTSVHLSF